MLLLSVVICNSFVAQGTSSQPTGEPTKTTAGSDTTTSQSGYKPDHPPKYDYGAVVAEALLFYEAERSGKLPANNRIPWRGDSALVDAGVGGY